MKHFFIGILAFLCPITMVSAQQCDLNDRNIFSQIDQDAHPYTTFYRAAPGGIFSYDKTPITSFSTFRTELRSILAIGDTTLDADRTYERVTFKVYEALFTTYADAIPVAYPEKGNNRHPVFPQQLKAKAFVLLCATDESGNALSPTELQSLRTDIANMFAAIDYGYGYFNGFLTAGEVSKNIIHYLQAYDYLLTDADINGNTTRYCEIKETIGEDLQALVKRYFRSVNIQWGSLNRNNDNHTLLAASVLGLAAVVLNDLGASGLSPHQQPEKWAETAFWRLDKTLFDETGRAESARDGSFGFAEGPYYYKYSFENLVPVFMGMKNGRSNPFMGSWEVRSFGYLNVVDEKRTINYNPVDDPDIGNLLKWYNDIQEPYGDAPTIDDTWENTAFIGQIGFQRTDWFSNGNMHFLNPSTSQIDLREEFIVAAVDGFFKRLKEQRDPLTANSIIFDNGSAVLRGLNDPQNPAHQQYMFINCESYFAGDDYLTRLGHEHDDMGSINLTVGNSRLLIDPFYTGYAKYRKNVNQGINHNTIFIQDDQNDDPVTPVHDNTAVQSINLNPIDESTVVTIDDMLFQGTNDFSVSRQIVQKNTQDFLYVIRDDVTDLDPSDATTLADRDFSIAFHGTGFNRLGAGLRHADGDEETLISRISSTSFEFDPDENKIVWSGYCDPNTATIYTRGGAGSINYGLEAYFFTVSPGNNSVFSIDTSFQSFVVEDGQEFADFHTRVLAKLDNANQVRFRTVFHAYQCDIGPVGTTIVDDNDIQGLVVNKKGSSTHKCLELFSSELANQHIWTYNGQDDTLIYVGDEITFCYEFDTTSYDCQMVGGFRNLNLYNGRFCTFNTDTVFVSSDTLDELFYAYKDLFTYKGRIRTANDYDTVSFYLKDVPDPNLVSMVEQSGLSFTYDDNTRIMTLYLMGAGTHNFTFAPADECVAACYFPDTINYHHKLYGFQTKRLGDEMKIVQNDGWLDMKKGAKMVICSGAICNNLDSLTLAACVDMDKESYSGFPVEYRNTENALYRQSYNIGSGSSLTSLSGIKRTMIVVEDKGALVLKSGSKTHVHNGGTILVKPGGTLKIEDGAFLEVGDSDDSCYGFGEIIIMDSAFLCIENMASIQFGNDGFDTIDRNIFFISTNPKNPAHADINTQSQAVSNGPCLDFCQMVNTFPDYGIDQPMHGWLNVGKLRPWLDIADTVVCPNIGVTFNGLYSLNETRYRFEITKYDTALGACFGPTTLVPKNDTDNYFGGRLQGSISLSEHYSFERGFNYKVEYKVMNDCGERDSLFEIIYLPEVLSAQVDGNTLVCGGLGAISAHGLNSTGQADSLRWEIWKYVEIPPYDSASYHQSADTFIVFSDTSYTDSVANGTTYWIIDSIALDTFWYHSADTLSDSLRFGQYYTEYFDTVIVSNAADTFHFDQLTFVSGSEYRVALTLYNECQVSRDSLTFQTKDGPTIDAGVDQSIPYGSPWVPLPRLNGSIGNGISHTWTPTTGLTLSTSLTPKASPSTTTKYVLTGTDADGCSNSDTVRVVVNTIAHAGRDTVICSSASVQVGVAAIPGYDYRWSPTSAVSNHEVAQPTALATTADITLILKIYQGTTLVGIDNVFIGRDVADAPNFSVNPGGGFYISAFEITHQTVAAGDLDWDFDDGTGTHTNKTSFFTYTYPPAPNAVYNVCASYTNTCGLQETCKDCEFDMSGNVIPIPGPTSLAEPTATDHIAVLPNPFKNTTTLSYDLSHGVLEGQIEIYDMTGRIISSYTINNAKGDVQIDLSAFSEGVYRYKFMVNGKLLKTDQLVLIK